MNSKLNFCKKILPLSAILIFAMFTTDLSSVSSKVIETRLIAYGPLYVTKPPKYWSNLGERFIKARNARR